MPDFIRLLISRFGVRLPGGVLGPRSTADWVRIFADMTS